jgi:hypothetical protein
LVERLVEKTASHSRNFLDHLRKQRQSPQEVIAGTSDSLPLQFVEAYNGSSDAISIFIGDNNRKLTIFPTLAGEHKGNGDNLFNACRR